MVEAQSNNWHRLAQNGANLCHTVPKVVSVTRFKPEPETRRYITRSIGPDC